MFETGSVGLAETQHFFFFFFFFFFLRLAYGEMKECTVARVHVFFVMS